MRLSDAVRILTEAGVSSPAHDARALFSHHLGLSDAALFGADPDTDSPTLIEGVRRRAAREPLQYLIGEAGFYREQYRVTPAVLIPREDTELLVDTVVRRVAPGMHILDLCTGSGCIAISVLNNTEGTVATAVDISIDALAVAKENAARYHLGDRVTFLQCDLLSDFPEGKYDVICSNPPYVRPEVYDTLAPEIAAEPRIAFVAEEDGLAFYRRILDAGLSHLAEGGFFALEIGYDQREGVEQLAIARGLRVNVYRDLGGNDRLAIIAP